MTRLEDRRTVRDHIAQARAAGARLRPACAEAGIDARTLQRRRRPDAGRLPAGCPSSGPVACAERDRTGADHRGGQRTTLRRHAAGADCAGTGRRGDLPRTSRPPSTHIAMRPGDVWCWDVTFLPTQIQGRWFYFYLILDLYSRKVLGFEVHETDSAEHAAHLAKRTAVAEGVHARPERPVLHGDNGASLKGITVLAMLHWLGIAPSHSRPRVSDDNAFAEALFRTAKYRPEFPTKGFADLEAA